MRPIEPGCLALIVPYPEGPGYIKNFSIIKAPPRSTHGKVVTVIRRAPEVENDTTGPVWVTSNPMHSRIPYIRKQSGLLRIDGDPDEQEVIESEEDSCSTT